MTWPFKITPIYAGLKPHEVIRWQVNDHDDARLGYASRYHHDGRSRWFAWRDDGLRAEAHSRAAAISILTERTAR